MKAPGQVFPASYPVRQALDEFLSKYGFASDEYAARTYWIDLFGWKLRLPNPRSRRVMVPLHDLHHIATGFGADLASEAEIGAWELRAGCTTPMLWFLNLSAAMLGLVLAPRRTLRAFSAGRGQTTLYHLKLGHEQALELTVGDLRRRLGIPEAGLIR
jgi:hypothetical protein